MIQVEKLSFSYPEKELYDTVSFEIERGDKCALIGSNGTGKTTLIDMLIHPDDYHFEGRIRTEGVDRIGYVSQFVQQDKQRDITVYDFLAEPFVQMQQEMEAVCTRMMDEPENETLIDRYQEQMDAFDAVDGYNYETNIHLQLKLAGLTYAAELKLESLSGGEFKLVQIVREMMQLSDLLILDEPDVFLDFENLNGLARLAKSYKGTLLVVTHNRYLLYHCFNRILHLENADLMAFNGTYAEYNLALLAAKVDAADKAYKDQMEIDRQNAVVDRLRENATEIDSTAKGRMLRGRVNYLNRLMNMQTKSPFLDLPEPKIVLPAVSAEEGSQSETAILSVSDYSISFDEVLLDQVSFSLGRGEKVAIVGPNGTGKTTLLRTIYEGFAPEIRLAEDARVGFLSQLYGDMLDESKTVREQLEDLDLCRGEELEAYLKDYYFEGDSLDKLVRFLSGGEKNLLQLAVIGKTDANLLLLDEPTSHLDTYAQIALENAIAAYTGAVLMVSHDFYTIANCADTVLYVEDKTLRRMSGRAFRKMIYKKYFDKDYLELDQKKKQMEIQIHRLLKEHDFKKAADILDQYEALVHRF